MNALQTKNIENQPSFFDFAAEVGLTKHIGSIQATEALIQLCHISKDSFVLDVGWALDSFPGKLPGDPPGSQAGRGSSPLIRLRPLSLAYGRAHPELP
jgi:hypothetical protein